MGQRLGSVGVFEEPVEEVVVKESSFLRPNEPLYAQKGRRHIRELSQEEEEGGGRWRSNEGVRKRKKKKKTPVSDEQLVRERESRERGR